MSQAPTTSAPASAADQHQAGQAALVSLIPAVLAQAWPLLDVHNIQGTLPQFTAAVKAVVQRYGAASAAAALAYYRSERLAAGVSGRPSLRLAPSPANAVIESAVQWATADLYGPVTPDATQAAQSKLDESVSQLVLDQGRQTILDAVQSDREAKGWVRVTEPGACSFCVMLALRGGAGLLYRKESSADFQAHDSCRCHAEPVFTAYEPSAQMRQMQRLWKESTQGRSGADARLAFRQALEGRPVTGKSGPKDKPKTVGKSTMTREQAAHNLATIKAIPRESEWRTQQIARLEKLLASK